MSFSVVTLLVVTMVPFLALVSLVAQGLQPILGLVGWVFITLVGWSIWALIRDSLGRARELHRIPCAKCQFFTNSPYLKCSLHPAIALTEEAIRCNDYQPRSSAASSSS